MRQDNSYVIQPGMEPDVSASPKYFWTKDHAVGFLFKALASPVDENPSYQNQGTESKMSSPGALPLPLASRAPCVQSPTDIRVGGLGTARGSAAAWLLKACNLQSGHSFPSCSDSLFLNNIRLNTTALPLVPLTMVQHNKHTLVHRKEDT